MQENSSLLGNSSVVENIADLLVLNRKVRADSRISLIYEGRSMTYAELREKVQRAAASLRAIDVKPGDRVMLVVPDSPAFVISFLATVALGAAAVPVRQGLDATEISYIASHLGTSLAIVHHGLTSKTSSLEQLEGCRGVISCSDGLAEEPELFGSRNIRPIDKAFAPERDTVAYCLLTSGTTGRPKAIMHRHTDFLHNAKSYADPVLQLSEADISISVPKLSSGYGMLCNLLFILSAGGTAVLIPGPATVPNVCDLIERHKASILFAQPRFVSEVAQHRVSAELIRSVRIVVTAGESLPASLYREFRSTYSSELLDSYGSTEMGALFISNSPGRVVPGSCGGLTSGYLAKIVCEKGLPVQRGQIGRLWVKGESMMLGYWKDIARTERAIKDGWLDTGDLFSQDEYDNFRCHGRADEMIKFGCGDWVAPAEVEAVVGQNEAVSECAVIALPDQNGFARLHAFVVLRPNFTPSPTLENDLLRTTKESWPELSYKHLESLQFISALPRTATGKIERFKLSPQALTQFSAQC
jgi:acyl-coenzyme A synthetase/AMP-(fatty) acid ligase